MRTKVDAAVLDEAMIRFRQGETRDMVRKALHIGDQRLSTALQASRYRNEFAALMDSHQHHNPGRRGPYQRDRARAHVFLNRKLISKQQEELADLQAALPAHARPCRTMKDFSTEELGALTAKIQRYVRDGTCRHWA